MSHRHDLPPAFAAFQDLGFKACVVVSYLTLNTSLNLLNRWALGLHGFKFPVILTAAHMLFGFIALAPVMLLRGAYAEQLQPILRSNWRGLLIVAVFNGVQISANNASLMSIEVSMNQVIRASIPVTVSVFAVCIERRVPSARQGAALLAITLGVILAVREESRQASSMTGILLTCVSCVLQSIQMSVAGRLLSGTKLDSFQMTFFTGLPAFCVLATYAGISGEWGRFNANVHNVGHLVSAAGIIGGSCLLALAYNVVLFQSLKSLSSVGTAILGNVKIVILFAAARVSLGELAHWTKLQGFGCLMTIAAAGWYTWTKVPMSTARSAAPGFAKTPSPDSARRSPTPAAAVSTPVDPRPAVQV